MTALLKSRDRNMHECSPREIGPDHPLRLLIRAYTRLFWISAREDGSKVAALASFGAYEVRLVELSAEWTRFTSHSLLLELFDHNRQWTLESIRCADIDEAGLAAEKLLTRARLLDQKPDAGTPHLP